MQLSPCCLLLGLLAFLAPIASAQTPSPSDPRQKLSMFVGTWTVEGSEKTYRETCEWLTRESFVVCRAEDTNPKERDVSLSIMGYSPEEQAYTYANFSGSGGSRTLRGWVHGEKWVFTGGRERDGTSARWQVTIIPNAKGFHFRQEVSENGAAWTTNFETRYVRLK
ncbi:MAG TPA: hypothetical protein VM240_06830 [Verrucomicrobiae bacterium]|nr:hypothetical protein [Verrucomicrobiae bacterium]